MKDDSRSDRTGDERPRAFALLDEENDAATRLEAVEALGNPSSSMVGSERRIADRLLRVVLTDDDATVRAEAIDALYFHGDRYIDELVSRVAAAVRRRDGDADPETVFARWLTSDHAAYRMVGATGLGAAGPSEMRGAADATRSPDAGQSPDATDRLRAAFDDDDARVRARAVRSYAARGGEAVASVRPLLRAPNALVRRAAVDALVSIGTTEATELLAAAADDGSDRLRKTVVERLHGLDHPESAAILIDAMRDPSPAVRRAAAASLARLVADSDAVRGRDVRDRLATDRPFRSDGDGAVTRLLSEVASDGKPERVTPAARRHAMWLCCELVERDGAGPSETAVSRLLDALGSDDRYVADIAAAYLSRSDAPALEREVRRLAGDAEADPDARERAQSVLRRLKRRTAASAADRSIEYVYVRRPVDYTEKHAE
ncbi:phycocyanobilin lyase [Halorubrum salipaludis]|uniref:Phycocyanobilin lyase n=1 Tax=Halorubrum salipaludis TaxID=2032630 RepID=A0A2A2FGR7_9EURY|nr:HEAT repeat domain-containing protein [Halorubrum salipaludis]PAU83755.1 phycocyanobilin lyase [Halorubrum salipaludis]